VKLTTRTPVNGQRHFVGRLESFQDGRVMLDLGAPHPKAENAGPRRLEVELANVEKANLVPEI